MSFWSKPLTVLLLIALGALVLWPLWGLSAALAFSNLALIVWLARHLNNLRQFRIWLRTHPSPTVPHGSGQWETAFAALHRLIRRHAQHESQLSEALERFREAGAAMPDGMVILDEEDRIEWCNPRAADHLGIALAHDSGQQVTYLVRHPEFMEYLAAPSHPDPLIVRLPLNMERTLAIHIVPYGQRQKLLFSRDITRFERAETMRRDFVANVSHELRTPLTVLCGFLETLEEPAHIDPELLRRTLRLMQEQAKRMQSLVEDLLTLSRLENAHHTLHEETVDIASLARMLHQDALSLSAGRHRISLNLENGFGLTGNSQELHSALSNLISNAVRYTPDGGEIRLRWHMIGEEPAFSVEDTGIGIEARHIPRLTERFYRVDLGRSRGTGGTGLGLAIVKHVLNRHQARLEVSSDPGKGSTFSAVFPPRRLVLLAQEQVASA